MKQLSKSAYFCAFFVLLLANRLTVNAQNSASCTFTLPNDPDPYLVTATVQPSSLSGQAFNVTLTLPGLAGNYASNQYTVLITALNPNLEFITSTYVNFTGTYPTYTSALIDCNTGLSFSAIYKFKSGITCNGDEGDFKIEVRLSGQTSVCTLNVKTIAEAYNYWKVSKEHVFGNLIGQPMEWKITLLNDHNPWGVGDYDIALGSTITDVVSCSNVIDVLDMNHQSIPFTQTAPNKVIWHTGRIASTTGYYVFYVKTICTDLNATKVINCLKPAIRLGNPRPPCMSGSFGKKICDTVQLTGTCNCTATLSKTHIYQLGMYNYAAGCEGECLICFNNSGNVAIEDINLTDLFPAGISVTQVNVSSFPYGSVNMDYVLNLPPGSFTGNTVVSTWFPSPNTSIYPTPTNMTFQSTSGALSTGKICLRIRFIITASAGTLIQNCANLSFNGIDGTPGGPLESCDTFVVEDAKPLPGIRKWVTNGQSFHVDSIIKFRIVIANHGAGALTGYTLMDPLGLPQNLLVISDSIKYAFGVANYPGYIPMNPFGLSTFSQAPPAWVQPDASDLQNPVWTINGMPGECRLAYAHYLVIDFKAKVLPTLFGQYTNITTLTGPATYTASAVYNVHDFANIEMEKLVSSVAGGPFSHDAYYIVPGNQYQYKMRITNIGSRPFDLVDVEDQDLSTCATVTGIVDVIGPDMSNPPSVSWNLSQFTFSPTQVLAPGQYVEFKINALRTSTCNDGNKCCNSARAKGKVHYPTWDNVITAGYGPVCVHPKDK